MKKTLYKMTNRKNIMHTILNLAKAALFIIGIYGFLNLIGTAGASDIGKINFAEILTASIKDLILIIISVFGINFLDELR